MSLRSSAGSERKPVPKADLRALLVPMLAHSQPESSVLWSGAGLSAPPPTKLPLGAELTQQVVRHACLPDTWVKLEQYFKSAGLRTHDGIAKTIPRLELVIESLYRVLGPAALVPLQRCAEAEPNAGHIFAARHVLGGGTHITCNIDDCIGRCLPADAHRRVVHVHGSVLGGEWDQLGIRLSRVAGLQLRSPAPSC